MTDVDLAKEIARVIRAARIEHRWSQDALANRLHVSQSKLARLESGRLTYIDAALASRAFKELGIRAAFDAQTLGLAGRREQRDLVHSAGEGYTARRLRAAGWDPRLEVEIGAARWRGWIDVMAYRSVDRSLLLGEIKTEVDDIGRIQRTLTWYEREAWSAATALGWHPQRLRSALLVLASGENDERLVRNTATIAELFAGSAGQLAAWLGGSGPPPPGPSLALIDPGSRRDNWLIASRSQGRRTPLPYHNYADAAQVLSAGRRR